MVRRYIGNDAYCGNTDLLDLLFGPDWRPMIFRLAKPVWTFQVKLPFGKINQNGRQSMTANVTRIFSLRAMAPFGNVSKFSDLTDSEMFKSTELLIEVIQPKKDRVRVREHDNTFIGFSGLSYEEVTDHC